MRCRNDTPPRNRSKQRRDLFGALPSLFLKTTPCTVERPLFSLAFSEIAIHAANAFDASGKTGA
jgi:hypothetical protein